MQALKLGFARRVLAAERRRSNAQPPLFDFCPDRIWQARYYDLNISTAKKRVEKLRYLHRNPVKRGLVTAPEQWRWSSFRSYAFEETGLVRIKEWGTPKLKRVEPISFAP